MIRRLLWAVAFAALLSATAFSQERPRAPSDYRETEAVLTHYPMVPGVHLDSPAFRASEPTLTSQEAMAAFLKTLAQRSRRVHLAGSTRARRPRQTPASMRL